MDAPLGKPPQILVLNVVFDKQHPVPKWCKNFVANMTFSTRNFDPLTSISRQIPKFCNTNIAFSLETHCCRRHTCTCATKFLHHFGTGCCLPKTTFRIKIRGGLG